MKKYFILLLLAISNYSYSQLINDESYVDTDFWKFKLKLASCVLEKDTSQLKEMLADRIHESMDICGKSGCSKNEFIQFYFVENGLDSWKDMETILRFGFSRVEDEFPERIIPHEKIVFQGPSYLQNVDTENELIVLAENVNIREKPSIHSAIIEKASFKKYKCDCNIDTMTDKTFQTADGIDWIEVKLGNGGVAYVASQFTSYELIKEMTVAKINGEWKIISFFHSPGC